MQRVNLLPMVIRATNEVRMLECDSALFKTGDRHRDLPRGSRRLATLNRAIDQWSVGIVQKRGILGAPFLRRNSL